MVIDPTKTSNNHRIIISAILLAIVFIALGFVQITFQYNLQKALNQSEANFNKMVQTQSIINTTLYNMSQVAPQSNFTAQAEGIENIETILENQERILTLLNSSR